jgi:hypothetical protein
VFIVELAEFVNLRSRIRPIETTAVVAAFVPMLITVLLHLLVATPTVSSTIKCAELMDIGTRVTANYIALRALQRLISELTGRVPAAPYHRKSLPLFQQLVRTIILNLISVQRHIASWIRVDLAFMKCAAFSSTS